MSATGESMDRSIFPITDWALVETRFEPSLMGVTETIFNVANGYLGMRGNIDEGREAVEHGTYLNGFHETWPIRHAEEAFGFARVGQTIVNAPDAKVVRLYVDDEPFHLTLSELESYERRLDFRAGDLQREIVWRTPGGKRVRISSNRLVSFADRHLAIIGYEVELLDDDAAVVISSHVLNRQDGVDEYARNGGNGGGNAGSGAAPTADTAGFATPPPASDVGINLPGGDPRRAEHLTARVLQPKLARGDEGRLLLGYRTVNSGMSICCGVDHVLDTECEWRADTVVDADLAKRVYRIDGRARTPIRLTKFISYHSAQTAPVRELADRCNRGLDRALEVPIATHRERQRAWLDEFWIDADVVLHGHPGLQQAMRWNLFQVAQAAGRSDGSGIAAKGVTGSGYGGHYFWDTEIYVLPFLTYTQPEAARAALRFRCDMLEAARRRAAELNQEGALFPWRTINGEESSAYYAASTAQYHIDADIAHAIAQYVEATGDTAFLANTAIDVLVETARLWADLGFWRSNAKSSFHIHGVTGPDEYTTVVNDNLFTNVMAQENLEIAADAVDWLRKKHPSAYAAAAARLTLRDAEMEEWRRAAASMHVPYDPQLGVHPQDDAFLEKEVWDLDHTPPEKRPLLLHYHPLVIYRHQVIKQADVVLALLLRGDRFSPGEKLRDFEYYDALTTGDSSLSAVVQSIIAAEVGHLALAEKYFRHAAFVDLADLHGNTDVGVHVASSGGMWSAAVFGFAGMRDHRGRITFDPRLPDGWQGIDFRLRLHGSRMHVRLRSDAIWFMLDGGDPITVTVRGKIVRVESSEPQIVPLEHQGERRTRRLGTHSIAGGHRADGSLLTASVPIITAPVRAIDDDGTWTTA